MSVFRGCIPKKMQFFLGGDCFFWSQMKFNIVPHSEKRQQSGVVVFWRICFLRKFSATIRSWDIVTLQMESLFNTPGVMKEFPNHWGVGDALNMAINGVCWCSLKKISRSSSLTIRNWKVIPTPKGSRIVYTVDPKNQWNKYGPMSLHLCLGWNNPSEIHWISAIYIGLITPCITGSGANFVASAIQPCVFWLSHESQQGLSLMNCYNWDSHKSARITYIISILIPKGSIYGICTYIYHKFKPNVGN